MELFYCKDATKLEWQAAYDMLADEFPDLKAQKTIRLRFIHLVMQREFDFNGTLVHVVGLLKRSDKSIKSSRDKEGVALAIISNLVRVSFPEFHQQDSNYNLQFRLHRHKQVQDRVGLSEAAEKDMILLCRELEAGTSPWGQWEAVLEEFYRRHEECRWVLIVDLNFVYMRSKMLLQELAVVKC